MRNHPPAPARIAGMLASLVAAALLAAGSASGGASTAQGAAGRNEEIAMTVGKSVILDHPDEIARISIANPEVADAVAVSTKEVLINAKAPGITTLVIWSRNGERNFFTLNVGANLQQIEQQIRSTFPGEDIQVLVSNNAVSLTGHVSSPAVAEKAAAMVATLGRTVVNNLSYAPPAEKQILLRVRFAEVQKSVQEQLGANILSTGALNTPGSISTQQFGPAHPADVTGTIGGTVTGTSTTFTLNDVLNIFAFRPDLNLAALIKALQSKNLIQILAEPNLIATSGKEAAFLVGGEFPFPVIQGGANAGAVTIQFREFGINLTFLPLLTSNQTIKLHVRPEVSSLDFANALTISGFTIPALSTRRVETDVELSAGQSFVIAGLINQQVNETFNRLPGLSNIPLLGNIFKSRNLQKNNSDLLVLVTPEFPVPLGVGEKPPEPHFSVPFMPLDYDPTKKPSASNKP